VQSGSPVRTAAGSAIPVPLFAFLPALAPLIPGLRIGWWWW
jgi:hypothetical protein